MPTVAVDKADLWERLGKEYCNRDPLLEIYFALTTLLATEEFDKLCFEYGLELDEDVRPIIDCAIHRTYHFDFLKTTEEVEEAIKKGLPAERPVC
jgi:phenylalanyl-tRNA synthetase beta chain